jgi:hypothetical protein
MLFHPVKLREFLRIQVDAPALHEDFEKKIMNPGCSLVFLKK